jgi:Holliday junction DNA helicase RuvA
MIGYLKGRIVWHQENRIIINVNGVGYLVEVTDPACIPVTGEVMETYVYTHVREDAISLYGFKGMEERELFTRLLSVSGIGPKAALNILSTLDYNKFINAVLTENIPLLKQIPGIGQKTAQRLVLELKNKVNDLTFDHTTINTGTYDEELYQALQSLGYHVNEIEDAISKVELAGKERIEDRIKEVLAYLGKER